MMRNYDQSIGKKDRHSMKIMSENVEDILKKTNIIATIFKFSAIDFTKFHKRYTHLLEIPELIIFVDNLYVF